MLDAFRHDKHLSRPQPHTSIPKINPHCSLYDKKDFIRLTMPVPDKIAFELDQLEMIVVHLGDDFRGPVV